MNFRLRTCCSVFSIGTLLTIATGVVAYGETAADPKSDTAQIEKLKKKIDQRDAVIRNLLQRVDRLERRLDARTRKASTNGEPFLDGSTNGRGAASTANQAGVIPVGTGNQVAAFSTAQAGGNSPAAPAANSEPGQFEVSAEAAQHALERALVESGALLLQPGQFELVPGISYQTNELTQSGQIAFTPTGALVTQNLLRSNLIQSTALLRVGLPWDAQAEFGTSYDYASSSVTAQVLGSGISKHSVQAWGLGDSWVTLTKQVAKEGEWMPSIFVSGTGNIGQIDNGLPLGTGFDWLKGSILAVKRQDPLVFTAGFSYQSNFENRGISPGDEYTPSVGMFFAVSPETSLQFNQQITFINDSKFHGTTVPGSSLVQGVFQAGILSILAPGVVVNLTAAIGETPDAPNLTVLLSFPITLN